MIGLDDLQKPVIAVVALGAAATAGFAVGVLVGRDPELARRLVGGLARGFVGARVAFAETMEAVGDFWAEATESAQRDIESERFEAEAEAQAVEPVAEARVAVPAVAGAGAAASAAARKRKPGVKRAAPRKTAARKRPRKAKAAKVASRARA